MSPAGAAVVPDRRPWVAVVEDYGPMRALLVRDLSGSGFRVDSYADAASLWRQFPHRHFDLVVLNIGLPDEDGFSVSRRLRRHTNIPVVLLSGYGSHEHQLLGLREGADAYLVKPVEPRVLVATLNRLARRRRADQGALPGTGGWWLVEQGWLLRPPGGPDIGLNGHERALLRTLAAADGGWLSGDRLEAALSRAGGAPGRRLLARTVWRLRRKVAAFTAVTLPLEEHQGAWRFVALSDERRPPGS